MREEVKAVFVVLLTIERGERREGKRGASLYYSFSFKQLTKMTRRKKLKYLHHLKTEREKREKEKTLLGFIYF